MSLPLLFVLSWICMLILPLFSIKLIFFAPFLVTSAKRLSGAKFLFASLLAGLVVDLFSTSTPFGFYTLLASLTALFSPLWTKISLKEERILYLTTTYLFVLTWTILELPLALIFQLPVNLSFSWILTDLLLLPLLDVLYTWILGIRLTQNERHSG